jgi:membrane-associated phospholipid phosphatase
MIASWMKKRTVRCVVALSMGLCLGWSAGPVRAESKDTASSGYRLGGKYFKKFALDFKDVVVSPAHWDCKDLLLLGATVAAAGVLYASDGRIGRWVIDHRATTSGGFTGFMGKLAELPSLGGLIAALYLSGEVFDRPGLRRTALLSLEAYVIHSAVSSTLKFAAGRSRYEMGEGPYAFHPFSVRFKTTSFPSGHSGSIFSVAAVIAGEARSWAVGALAYGVAGIAAVSRMHDMKHWASDILIGSVLGYSVGKFVRHRNAPGAGATDAARLSVGLGPGGFSVSCRF